MSRFLPTVPAGDKPSGGDPGQLGEIVNGIGRRHRVHPEVADLAGLAAADRQYFWGCQFLNPYATQDYLTHASR